MTFFDGATSLGNGTLSAGTASLTTNTLTVGSHSMTARYNGDATYATVTSSALTQVVNKADTTSSVVAKSAVYSNETLWVTVTVSGASPTGTVRLNIDGVQASSGALSGGTVKLGVRGLSIASHTVQAFYDGDAGNNASSTSTQSVAMRKGQRPQDFNVDGDADLLWYRASDGSAISWLMNGNVVDPASPGFGVGAAGFALIHSGDFDGDGKNDLLWYRASDGMLRIQFKDGPTSDVGTIAAGWQLKAVTDLNGDGTSDLLWFNATTGAATGWWMNGTQVTETPYTSPGAGFDLLTAADFDGDGKADLLWLRASDGNLTMQFPDGTTSFVAQVSGPWVLRGVGDMSGDGKADLFWFNTTDGSIGGWWMNGASQDPNSRGFGTADPGFELVGVTDFNGDGLADALWYRSSDGSVEIDLTTIDRFTVGTAPPGYVLRGLGSVIQ